ncbi:lantibiotic dehydratase [Streptomyces sp. NPDC052114]|uniref:lantibiotic dehydratase n=1 Tax=unclassified Streptomyces TaxID=2593676 RepID=UPI00341C9D2D
MPPGTPTPSGALRDGPFQPVHAALLRAPLRGSEPPAWLAAPSRAELLRAAAGDAVFMDALRVASPSLAESVVLAADPDRARAVPDGRLSKAAVSVVRYESRIRTRCTPFGLFAGVAPVRAGRSAKVRWRTAPASRTQVDLDWLAGLVRQWEGNGDLLAHLVVRSHAGLVTRGRRLVAVAPSDTAQGRGERRRDEVSIRHTAAVLAALEKAAGGALAGDVVRELEDRFPRAPAGAARRVVQALVGQEFLLTELRPAQDGSDALDQVVAVLDRVAEDCPAAREPLSALRSIADARARYDATPLGRRRDVLTELTTRMRELRATEQPLHVDLALGADVRLPVDVFDEAARAAGVLWRLSPPTPGAPQLRAYHAAFLERYGVDRTVPLPELLDDTRGLGAPAGYTWPRHSARSAESGSGAPPASSTDRDRFLAGIAARALRDGTREVVLDDADVERLVPRPLGPAQAPESCEFHVQLVAASQEELSRGAYLLVAGPWPGPLEAGATTGRFAGLLGSLVDEVSAAVAPPAEGGALPPGSHGSTAGDGRPAGDGTHRIDPVLPLTIAYQPRLGRGRNVSNCPPTAAHRLSLGVPPGPAEFEVGLDEIGVGAGPEHLYAVHLPSGRRLRPLAHHALDAQGQAPNAARLLFDIARFGQHHPRPWNWGPLDDLPYLPRVRHGRTVLSPARWRLDELHEPAAADRDRPDGTGTAEGASGAWRDAVAAWRRRWSVPRHLVVGRYDRRLRLDLECPHHLDVLRDAAAKQPDLLAEELPGGELPSGDARPDAWLRDASGAPHVTELVVPLRRSPALVPPAPVTSAARATPVSPVVQDTHRRLRLPGEEWLYAKLYLPARTADAFLCEHLAPLLDGLTPDERAAVDRWFFVRYRDEADHLRLRFHGPADALWHTFFPRFRDAVRQWTDEGAVGRFVLDTYDPEWERYGGPPVQRAVEDYFCADSRAALTLLTVARHGLPGLDGTALAACAVASLAHGLTRPPPGRGASRRYDDSTTRGAAWLSGLASARDLPEDFRARRAGWLRLIDPAGGWPGLRESAEGRAVLTALEACATALRTYERDLAAHRAQDPAAPSLARVVPSLTHLVCNRVLGHDRERERRAHALARACVLAHADRQRHGR